MIFGIRVHRARDHDFTARVSGRAVQLDGLRAIAMMAIAWDHWTHDVWPKVLPYEIFLFLFLVLTGYLITGSLLRERDRGEMRGGRWRFESLKNYQIRRGLRILAPYYAALAFAWVVRAPDVWPSLAWYVFHLSNIHMAVDGIWPAGTAHFWSLAMQQQFYLIWPFVIWFLPRKWLAPAILLVIAIAPISRFYEPLVYPYIVWPDKMLWAAFDYFGMGALFALAIHRGMPLQSRALKIAGIIAFVFYLYLFIGYPYGWPTFYLRSLQQTFLSITLCALIAAASTGFTGWRKAVLEHRFFQRVGMLSYGVYLYHNLAPLATGKILPFLWNGSFDRGPALLLKIAAYAGVTWLLTLASWRWIERPLQEVRSRMRPQK